MLMTNGSSGRRGDIIPIEYRHRSGPSTSMQNFNARVEKLPDVVTDMLCVK
jgi:hypothetical protein